MRLKEIEARLAQIKQELTTREAELKEDEITALEAEVTALQEERAAIVAAAEKRTALLARIANGEPVGDDGDGAEPTVLRNFKGAGGDGGNEPQDKYGSMAYRKAFMQYVCRGVAIPAEYRADAVSTTTDVGATIPTTVLNQIVEKLESTGMILALVTRTAYKGGVSIPVSTVKPTATWVNEGAGSDKQKKNIAKDGMITFAYHKLRCAVAVSLEVDTMAISAFETLLINNIVEAMTKALEQSIIDGDGAGKPKGILAETPAAGQEIESAAPAYADLIAAEAALPQAYENGAVWCMSKKTFMQYYGLTDNNGQPIGRVNYGIAGKPERTLLGRPVVCCDYVTSFAASLEAGKKFAFLFNFKDYVLNTNYAMGVKKYEDNDTDDMVTKGIMLVDGKVVDKNSLVVIKKLASV
nr:MAG TPA: major capsid protein [Caudoviricetes sp.]